MIKRAAALCCSVFLFAVSLYGSTPSSHAVNWAALDASVAVPGELLVGFKTPAGSGKVGVSAQARTAVHAAVGATVKFQYSLIACDQVVVPQGMSLKDAADRYQADPSVAYVEPNYIVHATAIPNDPRLPELWGMSRIHAQAAWDKTTGSTNVLVAVIDTGIDRDHPDLAANMWENPGETGLDGAGHDKKTNGIDDDANGYVDDWRGWDFVNNDNNPMDDHFHGTHCAGTIGGVGNNAVGVVGVNWSVKMVALKFLAADGYGDIANAAKAVQYATSKIPGVRLTSNSWGGGGYSQTMKNAIDAAALKNQLFIAAAGNNSANIDSGPFYPASYTSSNVIAVASITEAGVLSGFSNYGATSVDIAAPGSLILSTEPGSGYQLLSGTSMAAPHVSGAAALLWALDPTLTWSAVKSALLVSARPNAALTGRVVTGGELDVNAAIESLNPPILEQSLFSVLEGQTTNINVRLTKPPMADMTVTVARASGSTNLYVVPASPLVFTPANWSNDQSFAVGSWNDPTDMLNDEAVFQVTAHGGGEALFTLRQLDLGDVSPPVCTFSGAISADGSTVLIGIQFDENVVGFDSSDLVYSSNIAGGATLLDLTDVTGSNRTFLARFSIGSRLGCLTLTIPAGSLQDLSGNANPNPEYRFVYTLPWMKNDFSDDFEQGSVWTPSTNVYAELTEDGWRFGAPVFGPLWEGPLAAYSGSNCWGTMAGPYSLSLDGWVQSPPIAVGGSPVLSFRMWMGDGEGFVEVRGAGAWQRVSPVYTTSGAWELKQLALDPAQFGNRTLQVRFRAVDCALYVDDVRVDSERPSAVWVVSSSPTHGPAGTTIPVSFSVYNSTTSTLTNVTGSVSSPDYGVRIASGSPASYGTLEAGVVVTSLATVSLQLGAATNFGAPDIQLFHHFTDAGSLSASDNQAFTVDGVLASSATNLLFVKSSTGVTNGLGQRLPGDGSETSCLFQVIYAGPDGVADAPTDGGQVTDDDRVLYSYRTRQSLGRFGEGIKYGEVVANLGTFSKQFTHGLASNALVYVRAWDAATFDAATAYGNSALYAIRPLASQTNDFGSWCVGTPAPGSFTRDSNGDSIPDGWCILNGLDPRQPILPLVTGVISARAATDFSYPSRLAVSSNFVFVADTENNRVQVWDRALTNRLFVLGAATYNTNFSRPRGIAVSRDGARVVVADTANRRVRVFSVNSTNGVLTSLFMFGSYGTNTSQFNDPIAVAFGLAGEIYVADSQQSGTCNNRVQVFSAAGVFQQTYGSAGSGDGQFTRLLGIGMGADGTLYAADGANHRVQAFSSGTTYAGQIGSYGTALGQFNRVWDAQPGVGGLVYAADLYNKRIQILNAANPSAMSVVGAYTDAGSLGAFNLPQCAVPAPDDQVLYVADTYNSRVLRLKTTLDLDGDGMDDVWETLHGLNPNDPTDASADPDGDGVSNIGEYRAGTDPQKKDTDGDGAGDGWEMAYGLNPLVSNAVPANIPALTVTVSPTSSVSVGQTVIITATFSHTITNTPFLTLSGAVALGPVPMVGSGTNWTYSYLVPGSVAGVVDGTVGGAMGIGGILSDPPMAICHPLFIITPASIDLRISVLSMTTTSLGWQALSGDIYRIQSCTNLILTNWMDGVSVTSGVSGLLTVPSAFPTVEPVQFMRVKRLGP